MSSARRYIPVKQLIGHVPLIVQIADCRGREAQNGNVRISGQKSLDAGAPHFCAVAVELVKNNKVRLDCCELLFGHSHKLCVSKKTNVLWVIAIGSIFEIFQLGLKDLGAGGEPAHGLVRIVLTELEPDEGFAGTCGMNHGGFSCL